MRATRRFLLFASLLALLSASRTIAQTPISEANPGVSQLAARIGDLLVNANVKKVVFSDLKGPNGEVHPVGRWLADQLAIACSKSYPSLETIIRPSAEAENTPDFQKDPPKSVQDWARRVGADVVVTGTFAKIPSGIGVSLTALPVVGPQPAIARTAGLVLITAEIAALSPQPIPAAARAGIGGTTIPRCVSCPPPAYTRKARANRIEGSVVLQITVTAEGRATNIAIVKSLSPDLDAQAVKAVGTWKFKPAIGPNGQPTAVLVPLEVTFHLLN